MRLADVTDPKRRKERSKTGKQRLRAFLKKLPLTDAVDYYKGQEDLAARGGDSESR
ncbi:hypothetical protein [Paenibacillus darwinianus]|uniref:hypothetical protein n=1 Tax=Paenibacillus darwinianus TaxID=1380763 RepID=UPI000A3FCB32|nr:hypothetical protein [Paenibacillus darwinianus]